MPARINLRAIRRTRDQQRLADVLINTIRPSQKYDIMPVELPLFTARLGTRSLLGCYRNRRLERCQAEGRTHWLWTVATKIRREQYSPTG